MPARRKTVKTEITEEPEKGEFGDPDPFERARLDFGPAMSQVKVTILRYDEEGRQKYIRRVDYNPDITTLDWIRKKWGPGAYLLRFQSPEGKSWSQVVDIDRDEQPVPAAAPGSNADLVSVLREQNQILLQALLTRGNSGGGGNEVLAKLIEGMQNNSNTILQSALNRPDTSGSMLALFEKGLAIASEYKADTEGGWLAQLPRIARDVLPVLQEAAKARVMAGPPVPASSPALPGGEKPAAPAPAHSFVDTAPAAPTPAAPESGSQLDFAIRQLAPQVLEAAEAKANPEEVAETILQSVPMMFWPEFDSLAPDKILLIEPRLSQHQDFVEKLVQGLKDRGEEEPEPVQQ